MGIKKKVIAMFFVWGMLLALGNLVSIADNRLYMTGTFVLVLLATIFSKKIWHKVKAKMNWQVDDGGE